MKTKTKFWYIQDWGTYDVQTLVCVGYSIPEITKIVNRIKIKQEARNAWNADMRSTEAFMAEKSGGVWRSKGYTVLYLPVFEDAWNIYETLMHECLHLVVYQLGQCKMFINMSDGTIEEEGLAYQQEYLFRAIRRKLQNHFMETKRKALIKR